VGLRTFLLLTAIALTSPPALAARSGPSWPAGAAGLTATCDAQLARYREAIAAIGRRGTRSPFAATVLALEDAAADTADALSAATFAWSVTTDAAVRDASRACRLRWRDASADTLADPKLFAAIASAAPPRDAADRALARAWKSAMMRGGALLAPAKRDEFLRLAHELDSLEDRFVTNLADDRTTIRAGRRTLPVDDGTFDEVLLRSGDAQLREAFERAYFRRAAAANVPLLERAIAVRDRMSHVLGYESWADYRLAAAAMGGLAQAQQFLAGAAAANAGARPAAGTPAWDAWRGSENEAPPRSAQSVLDAVAQPFGIRFAPAGAAPWSDDVPAYGVTDSATGANLGTLYLDLYRRSGK
jgi:Zn-dependent oligopeptidase